MIEDSGYAEPSMKMAERCKPDYENMIKKINTRLNKSIAFRDAALLYFTGRQAKDKMAELIGELVTQCNVLQQEYDSLVQAQEENNESD